VRNCTISELNGLGTDLYSRRTHEKTGRELHVGARQLLVTYYISQNLTFQRFYNPFTGSPEGIRQWGLVVPGCYRP
jgi:hypothetical protein